MSALGCSEMDELLVDYLYDELDPARRPAFEEHLATCARCTAEVAAFRRVRQAARALPSEEPSAALSERLMAAAAGGNVVPLRPGLSTPAGERTTERVDPLPAPARGQAAAGPVTTLSSYAGQAIPRAAAKAMRWRWLRHPAWAAAASFVAVIGTTAYFLSSDRGAVTTPAISEYAPVEAAPAVESKREAAKAAAPDRPAEAPAASTVARATSDGARAKGGVGALRRDAPSVSDGLDLKARREEAGPGADTRGRAEGERLLDGLSARRLEPAPARPAMKAAGPEFDDRADKDAALGGRLGQQGGAGAKLDKKLAGYPSPAAAAERDQAPASRPPSLQSTPLSQAPLDESGSAAPRSRAAQNQAFKEPQATAGAAAAEPPARAYAPPPPARAAAPTASPAMGSGRGPAEPFAVPSASEHAFSLARQGDCGPLLELRAHLLANESSAPLSAAQHRQIAACLQQQADLSAAQQQSAAARARATGAQQKAKAQKRSTADGEAQH